MLKKEKKSQIFSSENKRNLFISHSFKAEKCVSDFKMTTTTRSNPIEKLTGEMGPFSLGKEGKSVLWVSLLSRRELSHSGKQVDLAFFRYPCVQRRCFHYCNIIAGKSNMAPVSERRRGFTGTDVISRNDLSISKPGGAVCVQAPWREGLGVYFDWCVMDNFVFCIIYSS